MFQLAVQLVPAGGVGLPLGHLLTEPGGKQNLPLPLVLQQLFHRPQTLHGLLLAAQLRPQLFHPQRHGLAAQEGVLHALPGNGPGHITLIHHAVGGDGCPVLPQLRYRLTADNAAQQVIDIASGQVVVGFHLLGQTALLSVGLLPLTDFAHIHQAVGLAAVALDAVIQGQGIVIDFRLHQQIELLGIQKTLHGAAPCFFPVGNFQHIGQNFHRRAGVSVLQSVG